MEPTPKLLAYLNDYQSFHRNRINGICHSIGVPIAVVTTLGLLASIPLGLTSESLIRFDLGLLLWFLAMTWFIFLDWKITVPFSFVMLGMYFLGRSLPLTALGALFVSSWALLLVGHFVFEKNSPALVKNLLHNLVAPMWIFSKLVGYQKK